MSSYTFVELELAFVEYIVSLRIFVNGVLQLESLSIQFSYALVL